MGGAPLQLVGVTFGEAPGRGVVAESALSLSAGRARLLRREHRPACESGHACVTAARQASASLRLVSGTVGETPGRGDSGRTVVSRHKDT